MHDDPTPQDAAGTLDQRRAIMALCAEARPVELEEALAAVGYAGGVTDLRAPEIGLVMTRARIGGDGRRFNLGEVTVTRAAVRLDGGETGFAYQLGRDKARARAAAVLDALWQSPARRAVVGEVLAGVARRVEAERALEARRAAATRVEFFTLVRGEDE